MTFSTAGARSLPRGESIGFFNWLISNAFSSCSPIQLNSLNSTRQIDKYLQKETESVFYVEKE